MHGAGLAKRDVQEGLSRRGTYKDGSPDEGRTGRGRKKRGVQKGIVTGAHEPLVHDPAVWPPAVAPLLSGSPLPLPCCPFPVRRGFLRGGGSRGIPPSSQPDQSTGFPTGPVRRRRPGRTNLPPLTTAFSAGVAGVSRRRTGHAIAGAMPRELRRCPFGSLHDEGPHRFRWGPSWTWTISRSRAVAAGFEPAVAINHTSFRVMHLRPLGHATAEHISGLAAHGSNLSGPDASQVTRRRAVAPQRCCPWRAGPWRARWIRTPLG